MVTILNWKITYLMRFFVFVELLLYLRTCLKNPGYASKNEIEIDIEAPEDYKTFIFFNKFIYRFNFSRNYCRKCLVKKGPNIVHCF